MKPFLVDVPVRVNIWIRPECQKKQFEVIKKARPSILFIQSDGGRNEREWDAIKRNRKLVDEGIDWECTVYRFYEDHNNGLYAMGKKVSDFIWKTVDRCIFLEDDLIPSVTYFEFCRELLERYKDDQRIECICGFNQLGTYDTAGLSYFFSRQGSIWGSATWKRVVEERNNFRYAENPYIMRLLKQRTTHNPIAWKRLNAYSCHEKYEGHVPGGEFWYEFDMYSQNRLQIVPSKNLISNIGATNNSEHAAELKLLPRGIRKVFNMPIYDMDMPIIHPEYVIPDLEYEKKRNRVMGYNTPIIEKVRKVERLLLLIRYGRIKEIFNRIFIKREEK